MYTKWPWRRSELSQCFLLLMISVCFTRTAYISVCIASQHAYACRLQNAILLWQTSPSVRLSVTLWHCIEKDVKLFPPSGSGRGMTRYLSDTAVNTKGTPSARSFNPRGGKICDFRQKPPFISQTVRYRPTVTMEH